MIIDYKILLAEAEVEKQRYLDEGRRLGRAEGLRPILHQFERRLARPLTDAERTLVASRFDLVGPERLGDVVFDLTPDALAAWLADPNAR